MTRQPYRRALPPRLAPAERMARKQAEKEKAKQQRQAKKEVTRYAGLRFNYGTIDEEHRELVRQAALDIRRRLKRTVEDMIEIGKLLTAVRAQLVDEGRYHEWLKIEFGMSIGNASEYRSIAERFGDRVSIIETLTPTIVRRLAAPSVPEEAVSAVCVAAKKSDKPIRVKDAMAIVKRVMDLYRPPKVAKPKQLAWPVDEPEPATIEAEYTIVAQPAARPGVVLRPELLRKMIDGAAHKIFMPFLTRAEHDELLIALTRALEE